ncbi:MAG: Flp pilus assembly protein CpaB [Bacillota bacterium]
MDVIRRLKRLIIPLLLAAVATYMVFLYTKPKETQPVEMVRVLVASRTVPARTVLTPDMLLTVQVPKVLAPRNATDSIEQVVGRTTVTPLAEGEMVLLSKLASQDERSGLAYYVPAGMRALTVAINDVIGVAGFIQPGDRVDVLATFSADLAGEEKTRLLLEEVLVLAVGQNVQASSKPQEVKGHNTVTLAVSPEEAVLLTLADERGTLRLALRPATGDRNRGPMEISAEYFSLAPGVALFEYKEQIRLIVHLYEVDLEELERLKIGQTMAIHELPFGFLNSLQGLVVGGKAHLITRADVITMNRDKASISFTETLSVESEGVIGWQDYGINLEITALAYNKPFFDLEISARSKILDILIDGGYRTGVTMAEGTIRIDPNEVIVIGGILTQTQLTLPAGVKTRYTLPSGMLSEKASAGQRGVITVIEAHLDPR